MRKVFFAAPVFDHRFVSEYTASIMMTGMYLQHHGWQVSAQFVGGLCFIDLARNQLTRSFLASDATDLFFIDSDVGWDYKATKRLLEYDEEIVAGLVPKRTSPLSFHDNALTGVVKGGLLETLEAPTAFMRIKRSVFEKMLEANPEYEFYNTLDKGLPFFQTGYVPVKDPTSKYKWTFEGEDIFFCRQWIKMGGKIWLDPSIDFTHRGSQDWKASYVEYGMAKGILTAVKEDSCPVEQKYLTGT